MNVKRFTARTSREAFAMVRQAFGEDAVVLSTKPAGDGVEVLAMAPDSVEQIERVADAAPQVSAPRGNARPAPRGESLAARVERQNAQPAAATGRRAAAPVAEVQEDVEQMAMSTLSFQDYVRERMLKRRQAAMGQDDIGSAGVRADHHVPAQPALRAPARAAAPEAPARRPLPRAQEPRHDDVRDTRPEPRDFAMPSLSTVAAAPVLEDAPARRDQQDMMNELRSMKGLIEERFGALAFMEKLQRQPRQALLAQKLLDAGFSPGLIRKLVDALPANAADEAVWAASVLERNLHAGDVEPALEEQGGVFALIGSTGVGKTTSTAKLAAAFATQYGATNLGLITLDAYRVGAHEQLRAYGRILGVPVHTAHDRASLEDLLELLAGKKMVLIDTAGMAQRDSRTRELLDMLSHRSIQRLLVVDASAQGETIDEVITNWRAAQCKGVVLSKIDEAVKLAPALDALIRHKLKVLGVANGQRVPEDWHRLSPNALVQRALRAPTSPTWKLEADDVQLVFATATRGGRSTGGASLPI
ncbi:MAG TPA: flagellar biosynthesis protein FlhF [Ideonella sp.]|uniref:flagellar biosynthesis protein FlhF n=1 Tax=Ideonella sp. TaxID=1929293 RepID=UPI002E30DF9A|nr:flagellar biosynthesis protein FlhF [Ideonella sp.]HEX5687809.1 flagellar biosynthesis protein FlhF [Ideonella sp.]